MTNDITAELLLRWQITGSKMMDAAGHPLDDSETPIDTVEICGAAVELIRACIGGVAQNSADEAAELHTWVVQFLDTRCSYERAKRSVFNEQDSVSRYN